MNSIVKIDELVWKMVGAAHEIIDLKKDAETYYPEMIPFLDYLIKTYPALKE